jgi:hypothetical protein
MTESKNVPGGTEMPSELRQIQASALRKLDRREASCLLGPLMVVAGAHKSSEQAKATDKVVQSYQWLMARSHGPLMFEDMYGNKYSDSEWVIYVYKQLMGLGDNEEDGFTRDVRNWPN